MVERCICVGVSLEELKAVAAREGLSFEALRERTACCTGCGLCEPYVRVMLATGRTRLPVMSEGEAKRVIAEAGKKS